MEHFFLIIFAFLTRTSMANASVEFSINGTMRSVTPWEEKSPANYEGTYVMSFSEPEFSRIHFIRLQLKTGKNSKVSSLHIQSVENGKAVFNWLSNFKKLKITGTEIYGKFLNEPPSILIKILKANVLNGTFVKPKSLPNEGPPPPAPGMIIGDLYLSLI